MSLLDTHPERFGWRYWRLPDLGQPPRLMPPIWRRDVVLNGPRVDASCPHGNRPPSPDCVCGLHYVPYEYTESFLSWKCAVINDYPPRPPYRRDAVTFGVALGRIMDDPDTYFTARYQARAKRAEAYRVLNIFIHEDHEQDADEIRKNHWCPTLLGITERGCRDALSIIPDDPSWFTDLEREPATSINTGREQ